MDDSARSFLVERCEETPYLAFSDTQTLDCFHRSHAMGIEVTRNRFTLLAFQIDRVCVFRHSRQASHIHSNISSDPDSFLERLP